MAMYKIEAIVREEKLEDVKRTLNGIDVNGITISQVMGCGVQKGYTELVRGTKIDIDLLPKIKFEIYVSSEEWRDKVIEVFKKAAWTGNVGDGKLFCFKIDSVLRIRTGETDIEALN
ncbi:MAG: P-II family nitrogen regulator [Ruminococcus sp.]|jgi:nitrogen regulatory protein P-II 1|nr:P-II family nitrogen regulator [Ruminococcus sp.]